MEYKKKKTVTNLFRDPRQSTCWVTSILVYDNKMKNNLTDIKLYSMPNVSL